ncbi:UDP-N-acetylmuramate dehydrogenase [Croceicoccus hydrothermalis]|uniref:UDP-N-acetylmuramate dehydrogenase n=1 Tax=Croceicoccus hydrothermalis TaxID=2867964 RepID=UPI001EFA8C4A|nr:UDP-N-acetylmuramate dehydrogenase [Croceicoccus hydrothermalis]
MADRYQSLLTALAEHGSVRIGVDVPLRTIARWRIGGPCDVLLEPLNQDGLSCTLRELNGSGLPFVVVGDGSNLLFDDAGFRGVVIRIGRNLSNFAIEDTRVTAEAGIWIPNFVRRVGCAGLKGAEHAVGIPGTLGGLLVMNGGSQRKGIGENVVSVTGIDMQGERIVLTREECNFSYRSSVLQELKLVVVEAEFQFERTDAMESRHEMIGIMASRRKKFPLRLPNCGSVFLSDPAMYEIVGPPGKVIEDAGLRGTRIGDAQIAENHGNFIVNLGAASSKDVLSLIHMIRNTVHDRTEFWLRCEVRYLSPESGDIIPAHLVPAGGNGSIH